MPVVDVDGLSFTYAAATSPAVRDLSFRIDGGEIFGFLGPSGAGKSTTQKVLIGLLRGYRGAVSVLGRDLAAWGSDYYEQIGVSFELPNHYLRLTGAENLAYFRALYAGETRHPEALLLFLEAPSDSDQAHRLRRRGDSEDHVRARLSYGPSERETARSLGAVVVVNADLNETTAEMGRIIDVERRRREAAPDGETGGESGCDR